MLDLQFNRRCAVTWKKSPEADVREPGYSWTNTELYKLLCLDDDIVDRVRTSLLDSSTYCRVKAGNMPWTGHHRAHTQSSHFESQESCMDYMLYQSISCICQKIHCEEDKNIYKLPQSISHFYFSNINSMRIQKRTAWGHFKLIWKALVIHLAKVKALKP